MYLFCLWQLLLFFIFFSVSKQEKNVKILSLVPFLGCKKNNESSDEVKFLRNYVEPRSLCELSSSALQGLNKGIEAVNRENYHTNLAVTHRETQVKLGKHLIFIFVSKLSLKSFCCSVGQQ